MPNYIINKKPDEHNYNELHRSTCAYLPDEKNQVSIGWFATNKEAKAYAIAQGWNADGCWHCCSDIHRG